MRVIRKQCKHGERTGEEEAVSSGSWKELSEVLDDGNIQEEKLDEAIDAHWEVCDSTVDESTSTDDKTVMTKGMKCMKRSMYTRTKFYTFVKIERRGNR